MKKFFVVLAMLLMFDTIHGGEPPHVQQALRMIKEEAGFLRSGGLEWMSWGGSFQEKINKMMVMAQLPCAVERDKLKDVFAVMLFDWICAANSDVAAIPYFKDTPMTADNLQLRILTKDFDVPSTEAEPIITLIFNAGDTVVYCYREATTNRITPFLRESFEGTMQNIMRKIYETNPEIFQQS